MPYSRRKFIQAGTGAIVGLSLWGCSRESSPVEPSASGTTVFLNGNVLPVDPAFTEHSALAIRGGRVLAVGNRDDVLALAGRNAATVDLDGRVILPGFIEPHMHFALLAGLGHLRDIGPFQKATFEDALHAIREILDTSGIACQAIPAYLLYWSGLGMTTSGLVGSAAHS